MVFYGDWNNSSLEHHNNSYNILVILSTNRVYWMLHFSIDENENSFGVHFL